MKYIAYTLLAVVLSCTFTLSAAKPQKMEVRKVDFEEIRKATQDTVDGKHFYPRLMAAFMRNDTTLLNDTLPSG